MRQISDEAVQAAMSAKFGDYRAEVDGDPDEYQFGEITLPELLHRYGAHHAVDEEEMVRAILAAAAPFMGDQA